MMVKGFFWLVLAYGLSQFYRACLAVFAPVLNADIGLSADQVSTALGLWFLAFAAMQIPVGWLLDHKSPRMTAALLLTFGGGGGALVFAAATGPMSIYFAMAMIGIGCSSVLMTSLYLFARLAPTERFGTLAGLVLGIGSLGNLAASMPLTLALDAIGWRVTMIVLAVVSIGVAAALARFVQDPPLMERGADAPKNSLLDMMKIWPLYPVLAIALVIYAPSAGLRGSWIGGYMADVYGQSSTQIGTATIVMAVAMILGSLIFGPADRIIKSYRVIVAGCGVVTLAGLVVLWRGAGDVSVMSSVVLFSLIGFFGAAYPQIMNHGRTLLPMDLTGRGVTMINLFTIGGAGIMQVVTARVYAGVADSGGTAIEAYQAVFACFGLVMALGLVAYLIPIKGAKTPD